MASGMDMNQYPDSTGEDHSQPGEAQNHDDAVQHQVPTQHGIPQSLCNLFYYEACVEDPVDVVVEAIRTLANAGINSPQRLHAAPDDLLRVLFPFQSHATHYMSVTHVKNFLAESLKQPSGNEALAEAMLKMAKEQEKTRKALKENKRKRATTDSESEDEGKKQYQCSQTLVQYTMEGLNHIHMTPATKMQEAAKRACQGFKSRGNYLVPGPITDYCPQWMHSRTAVQAIPKDVSTIPTHAHWVAAWWGRALTQLSCQGEAKLESVSLRELLQQFLNMNQMAVEVNNKVAWTYDQQLWDNLVDRIRRHEPGLDVAKEFTSVTHDEKKRIADMLLTVRQPGQSTPGQSSNSQYTEPVQTTYKQPTPNPSKPKQPWGGKGQPKGGKQQPKGGKPSGGKGTPKGQPKGGKFVKTEK